MLIVLAKNLLFRLACLGRDDWYLSIKGRAVLVASRLGAYERLYMRLLPRFVRPGSDAIDAGANVGAYSGPIARLLGPAGRLFAFEPVPRTAAFLERSCRRFGNVTVVPEVLFDLSDTMVELRVPLLPGGVPEPALAAIVDRNHGGDLRARKVFPVRARRLDDHIARFRDISFIKVDIEGGEAAFLAGAGTCVVGSSDKSGRIQGDNWRMNAAASGAAHVTAISTPSGQMRQVRSPAVWVSPSVCSLAFTSMVLTVVDDSRCRPGKRVGLKRVRWASSSRPECVTLRSLVWKNPALVLLLLGSLLGTREVGAQTMPTAGSADEGIRSGRIRWELAGGPAVEVATPGDRQRERGVLVVPSIGIGVASWFEIVVEGHAARYVTPVSGHVFGVVPIGWRIHSRGQTQLYLSAGAGVAWTNLTGLRGVEQRRNFLTQIGAGIRRERSNGSAVSVEARFFHFSNLSSAPPNLGMEVFAVLARYRLAP